MKVTLRITDDQFHELHELVDPGGKGKRAKKVTVDRGLLGLLLMDYSNMLGELKTTEAVEIRRLPNDTSVS